jgi:coniferyl-aldehyde dehydrogenase
MADALGAGNRCIVKPSEFTPATSALLKKLCAKYFSEDEVAVVLGESKTSAFLCSLPFDHILYTGSPAVGKLVAAAAAPNLTPCTLELGGKCPVVICPDADVKLVAESVLTTKLAVNAGQVCVAPDYVMVPKGKGKAFADACVAEAKKSWGGDFSSKEGYCGIISRRHYDRLQGLCDDAIEKGATVVELDANATNYGPGSTLRFPPKCVLGLTGQMALNEEEIFGPVLPVIEYEDVEAAITYVNARPRPLALYLFTNDNSHKAEICERTVSGGVTVNGCGMHCIPQTMPFGGIGNSGMGAYHGQDGFKTFSHKKPIFEMHKISTERGPSNCEPAEFFININPQAKIVQVKTLLPVLTLLALSGTAFLLRSPFKAGLVSALQMALSFLGEPKAKTR